MVKKQGLAGAGGSGDNAFARKALEAIAEIEEEASRKKTEQLEALREALKNIDSRLSELTHQRAQVQEAIEKITGKPSGGAPRGRKPRVNLDDVRGRVVRWLVSHQGESYLASELQREFPELDGLPSIAAFLKKPIGEGVIHVDKSGGNRNTRYSAAAQ